MTEAATAALRLHHLRVALVLAHLCACMPGHQSAYSASGPLTSAQQSRIQRDRWYRSAHSRRMKFIEVHRDVAADVGVMARAKEVHFARDAVNPVPAHAARSASLRAAASGAISTERLRSDLSLYKRANRAKHEHSRIPTLSGTEGSPAPCGTLCSRSPPSSGPAFLPPVNGLRWADVADDGVPDTEGGCPGPRAESPPDKVADTLPAQDCAALREGGCPGLRAESPLDTPLQDPSAEWDGPGSYLDSLDWDIPIAWSVAALADRLDLATLSLERLSADVAAMPTSTLRAAAALIKDAVDAPASGLTNTIETAFGLVSERFMGSILARPASVENLFGALRPDQRLLDLAARVDSLEKLLPNTSVRACGSRAPTRGRSSTPCRSLSQPSGSASSPPRGRRVLTPAPFPAQADLWEGSCPAPELRADPSGPGCVDPEGFEPFGDDIFVRTCGLQNQLFNGLVGKVLPGGRRNGRLPVHVFNIGEKKLFRPGNLVPYCPDQGDCCQVCHQRLNLYAFPCCSCPTCPTSEVAADAYG